MKNKILKITFVIAFCLYIITLFTYGTGIRTWAVVINILASLYIGLFAYANRGNWIFK